jgi:hypothetical protein
MFSGPERVSQNRALPRTIPGVEGVPKEKALQRTISHSERVSLIRIVAWDKPIP